MDYNIKGERLKICGKNPITGFYRNGYCQTGRDDIGLHLVCAKMDKTFLKKTKELGNDLITPTADFKGLKPGDKWCLCANRWKQAKKYGVAPIVDIDATNKKVEKYIDKYTLYDNIEDFQNNYIPCG